MMLKRLTVALIILFCIATQAYSNSVDGAENEAQKSSDFISWQKNLGWNIGSILDYFLDSSVSNEVRPLSGQWEVYAKFETGIRERDNLGNFSSKKTHWIYNYGDNVPLVLFGEKAGASPMYSGITYRFGVRTGKHVLSSLDLDKQRHLRIKVYDLEASLQPSKQLSTQKPYLSL